RIEADICRGTCLHVACTPRVGGSAYGGSAYTDGSLFLFLFPFRFRIFPGSICLRARRATLGAEATRSIDRLVRAVCRIEREIGCGTGLHVAQWRLRCGVGLCGRTGGRRRLIGALFRCLCVVGPWRRALGAETTRTIGRLVRAICRIKGEIGLSAGNDVAFVADLPDGGFGRAWRGRFGRSRRRRRRALVAKTTRPLV